MAITRWMGTEPGVLRRAIREDRGSAMTLPEAAQALRRVGRA